MSSASSSISDLKKQLEALSAELGNRQKNIRHELKAEFEARLAEADLVITDIYPELAKAVKGKKGGRGGSASSGATSPKYRNPHGFETWTGRGRPPRWVVDIMEAQNLSLEAFKMSNEYKAI